MSLPASASDRVRCPACNGKGTIPYPMTKLSRECEWCLGAKEISAEGIDRQRRPRRYTCCVLARECPTQCTCEAVVFCPAHGKQCFGRHG